MPPDAANSDSPAVTRTSLAAAPNAVALLTATDVLAAVADPVRYQLVRLLAPGAPLSVAQLAAALNYYPDAISKQLKNLRAARIVITVPSPDGDGRKLFHEIPAVFRSRDAAGRTVLDFGGVALRF